MDESIKYTRRISLPTKYEFWELEGYNLELIEERVAYIKENMGTPSPEISPKTSDSPYEELLQWDGENKVRLIGFLKEKDKWIEINTYLKGLGFTWIKDGTDSRWER